MTSSRVLGIALFLCVFLFLKPSDAYHSLSIDDKIINELITPIIVNAVLKEMHSHAEEERDEETDNDSSPQHQQPYFIPVSWQPMSNHPVMQQQPYHHPQMLPLMHLLPLPFHHHHPQPHLHAHPQAPMHPQSHLHTDPQVPVHPQSHLHADPQAPMHPHSHPLAHPQSIAIIQHEMIPTIFHQQMVSQIIHQLQQPTINHQQVSGMHAIEIIEKLPIWVASMPHANPVFHQPMNYVPLIHHNMH